MDEIFGYFPPTANPPSKRPMLLLLKQARAYGLGVVLATQNPVDLDYKGLANIGSWFIGRLQTVQDQDRVLNGIVGAGSGFSRNEVRTLLADMKGRRFILASAYRDEPVLFETRWVMSYLKGPIGLPEIATLMKGRRGGSGAAAAPADRDHWSGQLSDQAPLLSNGVDQRYCQPPLLVEQPVFQPWLAVAASVRFYQASRAIDEVRHCSLRVPLDGSFARIDWQAAEPLAIDPDSCADAPPSNSLFHGLPAEITAMRDLRAVERDFADYLYQTQRLELLRAPAVKLESRPGESAADFRVRIGDVLREQKDEAAEKVLAGFARKREQLAKRLEAAYLKVDKERGDVSARKTDSLISFGTAILGAVLGRKALSTTTMTRTAGSIRSVGRVAKEKQDVRRAEDAAALIEQQINELDADQQEAITALTDSYDPARVEIETIWLKPRRADIFEVRACLIWEMVVPATPRHG
jgi:hypothetical protein